MGKKNKYLLLGLICAAVVLMAALWAPDWEGAEKLPLSVRMQIWWQWHQAEKLLTQQESDRDGKEQCLADSQIAVLDSNAVYPEYLAHPEGLRRFVQAVQEGRNAYASLFRITEEGELRQLLFQCRDGQVWFHTTQRNGEQLETATLPVYDMELADWGVFYYRCYPAGDPHYIDYSQIRLQPADRELWRLNQKYVRFLGYQFVNLFLIDWQEGNWGNLSFGDTLDSFYEARTGEKLGWEKEGFSGTPSRVQIPAEVFEETVLPYFAIDLETFRVLADYDGLTDSYPWCPIEGEDITPWHYPLCEPEVVSWQENGDGTLTLQVQVYSPDLKTDRLFCHAVTVRPLEDGFQYVSNRITYVSGQGLPPALSRFQLNGE